MQVRGIVFIVCNFARGLFCRYYHRGNPYLIIGPLKVEEAYLDPRIVIFHDVIFDDEIATLKVNYFLIETLDLIF